MGPVRSQAPSKVGIEVSRMSLGAEQVQERISPCYYPERHIQEYT